MAPKGQKMHEQENVELIRVLGRDIRSDKNVIVGLTNIKGLSWAFAGALCTALRIDTAKKVHELTPSEIQQIEAFMKHPDVPEFMRNRQKDFDTGHALHLYGPDLNLRGEFDIKRLRKIKSYRGTRHANKLPVRGQRTKANFRRNRQKSGSVGMKKK